MTILLRRLELVILVVTWSFVAEPAQADERVSLTTDAAAEEAQALSVAIAATVAPAAVELTKVDRVRPEQVMAAPPSDVLAQIWVAWGRDGALVVLLSGGGERGVARRLPRDGASDEVLREEIALVVGAAVDTLRVDARSLVARDTIREALGVAPPLPPPSPEPSPVPTPSPTEPTPEPPPTIAPRPAPTQAVPPSWRLSGGGFYEGQGFAADELVVHGPGLALGIGGPALALSPKLEFLAQYRFPAVAEGPDAGLKLHSGAFRMLVELAPFRTSRVGFGLLGGLGVDVLRIEPFLVDQRTTLLPARTRVAPLFRFGLGLSVRVIGETSVRLGAGADVDVIGPRYVVQDGETLLPILDPLRLRPSILVGLDTTLAGRAFFRGQP